MKIRVVNGSGRRLRRRARKNTHSSGGGGVFIVAKTKRHRRHGSTRRRHRRSNPFGFGRVRHRHSGRRRRRNPGGIGGTIRDISGLLLWGTGGAVASLAGPAFVAPQYNTGAIGYVLNGATAWLGGMIVGKMAGPQAGAHFMAGGLIATGLRIFNNFFGSTFPIGLSDGMGYYVENSFPLPTAGSGPYLLNPGYSGSPMPSVVSASQSSAAQAAAAAALPQAASDEPSRWGNRWAA